MLVDCTVPTGAKFTPSVERDTVKNVSFVEPSAHCTVMLDCITDVNANVVGEDGVALYWGLNVTRLPVAGTTASVLRSRLLNVELLGACCASNSAGNGVGDIVSPLMPQL